MQVTRPPQLEAKREAAAKFRSFRNGSQVANGKTFFLTVGFEVFFLFVVFFFWGGKGWLGFFVVLQVIFSKLFLWVVQGISRCFFLRNKVTFGSEGAATVDGSEIPAGQPPNMYETPGTYWEKNYHINW